MAEFKIDRSRHDDAVWYGLPFLERTWRDVACSSNEMRDLVVRPEVREAMAQSVSAHVYGYRYLEPEHLVPPWAPALLVAMDRVQAAVGHYKSWSVPGEFREVWWTGEDTSDPSLSTGERTFQIAERMFSEAGLPDIVAWVGAAREVFRKRVRLMALDVRWVPFQVDINSPSVFCTVSGPDVWQTVVDAMVADRKDEARSFLENMRMASLKAVAELPSSYLVSQEVPSFGYRREHTNPALFVGWAAATMPEADLFGPTFWPAQGSDGSGSTA